MKLSITFKTLVLLTVAIITGSSTALADGMTPWREWDFNNVQFAFGRYADPGSVINMEAAKEDWQRNDIEAQIEIATLNEETQELSYSTQNVTLAHAFCKHEIRNHQIQGGQNLYLNSGWPLFGSLMDNIVFNAPTGCFGFCNESNSNTAGLDCQDRYIALKGGASFTIPDLQAGDWVVIKMDRNVGTANLKITGAKDALGNNIDQYDNYGIGGCQWFDNNGQYYWRGEYHFLATGNSMTFNYVGANGQMLKLYNIKVYRNAPAFPSENDIVCYRHLGQTFYFDKNSANTQTGHYELHYRGKAEKTDFISVIKNGYLSISASSFSKSGDYKYLMTAKKGEWGIFKVRLASKEHSGKYYTDYAERVCSQTYLNKVDYPCTWDFTDLIGYFDAHAYKENPAYLQNQDPDLAFWKLDGDFGGSHSYLFQMAVPKEGEMAGHNAQYVNGGELHLADHAFPELEGLGVSAFNWGGYVYNNQLKITSEGIEINSKAEVNGVNRGTPFKFHIPEIDGNSEKAAVYVRVKKINDAIACFNYQKSSADTTRMELVGIDPETSEFVYRTPLITSNDNITLWLNGCVVKKIAVTKDFKSVNELGYSTESRVRDIDHTLTTYFSAGNIKAYRVSDIDYDNSKVTLAVVDKILPNASTYGAEGHGVILYNTNEVEDKSVSDFGLFVADVHDKDNSDLKLSETNLLVGNLSQNNSIGAYPGTYTNYLLSSKGTNVVTGETVTGVEAFYRASKTAKLGPNKAYLPMLTEKVMPSDLNLAGAKMSIVFEEESDDDNNTTGIHTVNNNRMEDDAYYTLSGMKVEHPTKSGIYIKNGKKIFVK